MGNYGAYYSLLEKEARRGVQTKVELEVIPDPSCKQ